MAKKILCLGDSLTRGAGVTSLAFTYPEYLNQILKNFGSYQVINAGVDGDNSGGGCMRLISLINMYQPQLIITCYGTNDMIGGADRGAIKHYLMTICNTNTMFGIKNLLLGVPDYTKGVPATAPIDHPLYAEISRELEVPLLSNILAQLECNPAFKSDMVHLNDFGYISWAQHIANKIIYESII